MNALFEFALSGVNLIPTILLGLVIVYWITVILGLIDIDVLDFDIDLDLDVADGFDGSQGLLAFLNLKDVPVMIVVSVFALVFWISSMLLGFLPIRPGGWMNGLCMIPAVLISILLTKAATNPMKKLFQRDEKELMYQDTPIIGQIAVMNCSLDGDRLGQAEIMRDGASILIHVKADIIGETFQKQEHVYVTRRDDSGIYYIVKCQIK